MLALSRLHESGLASHVTLGECWARDGLQNEAVVVPTDRKVEMITGMVHAGFQRIEATNFAHPKYLPQFADAEAVLERIPRRPDVHYRGICTTPKGVERAISSKERGFGVDEIAFVLSASEAHNRANVKMSRDENKALLESMAKSAIDSGHEVFGWVLTSFGCPIQGDVPASEAIAIGKWWRDIGASYVGFGDTTGVANPKQVSQFYTAALDAGLPKDRLVAHFHDTRGWGMVNTLTAPSVGNPRRVLRTITEASPETPAPRISSGCSRRWGFTRGSTFQRSSRSVRAPSRCSVGDCAATSFRPARSRMAASSTTSSGASREQPAPHR
jgi:hydroxymethylglutaryl-CoA lyase